ncbi:hypothetical protein G6F57_006249 [Rhizopus arrhizus]|uniref:Uncharacterized protein n=1 Tax=Rhizopus oryzae TaxID=64495 RepID=A0A9P6X887_RHIOR|nr:hypothetical protein G6F23_005949 [Rhizopus arrhizus]KAG1416079.1 hypothetical protein G6F58_006153 [Rhizopus delemar]KAG0763427.1 hypothetical protein G6F24_006030 [Rhizopus arrhizus]KAG0910983.1 hypothetical protein G6F33_007393 [Rhizopus arrhizus]KAG0939475.1 hypothetical protein G6F30_007228 [Rhizopus arrhizus]
MNYTKQLTAKTCRSTPIITNRKTASNMANQRFMSAYSHMSDNDPEVLEKEKKRHLSAKEKKEWNEKLASTSEANVKADKEADIPIKDLQNKTAEHHTKHRDDKDED